jgi:signal transduction histidine kinase
MPQEKYEIAVGIVIATITFLLGGFFILILVAYFTRRKKLYIQERKQMQDTFEQELLKTRLETQEETFSQIGRELHDNVGQLLSSTKMLLGIAERTLPEVPDALRTAEQTLGKAIQDIRSLSKSLDKEWLHQFNIIDNLSAETERMRVANSLSVTLHAQSPSISMEPESQVILFRIVQEALQNTLKHAQATQIQIRIEESLHGLKVSVLDNGKGFLESQLQHRGMGLNNMQKRTRLLGGTVQWNAPKTGGTEVKIVIPTKMEV